MLRNLKVLHQLKLNCVFFGVFVGKSHAGLVNRLHRAVGDLSMLTRHSDSPLDKCTSVVPPGWRWWCWGVPGEDDGR